MTKQNIKWKIIQLALNALKNNFQIQAEIEKFEVTNNYQRADFILNMVVQGRELRFYAEVKTNVTKAGLFFMQQLNNMGNLKPMIFVTRYVNTTMADELKQRGIEFIDTAGNAYINQPHLYIFIKGNKPTETFTRIPHNRAFQPTGLKLIYAFLCNADLVNKPYRAMAATTNLALGTVGLVMNDLKELNFILDMGNKRGKKIIRREELFQKWVTAYPEKLRFKQILGHFRGDQEWWRQKQLGLFNAQWGGEVAAAELTQYLKPQVITIYTTPQDLNKLLIENRLRKDDAGDVEILKRFWLTEQEWQYKHIVHPILIYADLIATGDQRNIEVAKEIYDRYIVRLIRED